MGGAEVRVATPLVNSPSCSRRPSSDETLVLVIVELLSTIFITTKLAVLPSVEGRAAPVRHVEAASL